MSITLQKAPLLPKKQEEKIQIIDNQESVRKQLAKNTLGGKLVYNYTVKDGKSKKKHLADVGRQIEIVFSYSGIWGYLPSRFSNTSVKTTVDEKGEFRVKLPQNVNKIAIKILEKNQNTPKMEVVDTIICKDFKVLKNNSIDLGLVKQKWWAPPESFTKIPKTPKPYEQTKDYNKRFRKGVLPNIIKRTILSPFTGILSKESMLSFYNLTGNSYPKETPTPKKLINALCNQICAIEPKTVNKKTGEIVWEVKFDAKKDYDKDQLDKLPEMIRVTAQRGMKKGVKDKDQTLTLKTIEYQFHKKPLKKVDFKTFSTSNKEQMRVMEFVLTLTALVGEARNHLGGGHVTVDQFARVFARFIHENHPCRSFMKYLWEAFNINELGGKGIIFGPGGILETGFVKPKAADRTIKEGVDKHASRLFTYEPKALSKEHKQDKLGERFFKVMLKFVTNFMTEKGVAKKLKEKKYWIPIRNLSETLPLMNKNFPSITKTDTPQPGEIKKFARAMTFILYCTTFHHSRFHNGQGPLANLLAELKPSDKSVTNKTLGIAHGLLDVIQSAIEKDGHPALKKALLKEFAPEIKNGTFKVSMGVSI